MKLSDKVTSLLKEEDYSFEELKQKTNASFFELKDLIKELLKDERIFKNGFPTKYSLQDSSKNIFHSKTIISSTRTLEDYKEVFLTITILLLLVIVYSVFLKNPFLYPGLEQRTFLLFLPLLLITILLYIPWLKIASIIPKPIMPKEVFVFLDKAKHIPSTKELKHFSKEFLEKILVPYYPHLLIILSVISLFKIEFFSSFNEFFSPIALHLILISIILIMLKQKRPFFFKEKEICKYAFLLFLLLVTLSSLKFEQIAFITKPLIEIQFQLTIITIILGAITFWQNKEVLEQIEEEQNTEEKEEQKRAAEFGEKYPKLAKIPLVNKVTKWMYKEGKWYSTAVISLIIIGFLIRLYRLGDLGLWWDELITGTYVLRILETGFPLYPSDWGYYWRGVAYHYFVAIFTFLFGANEFWIRFPSVLFGMGIAISGFLFAKKINKKIAIFILFFLIFSTFNIEYSRFARFYVMNAFLFMVTIWTFWKGFFENKLKYKFVSVFLFLLMLHTVQTGAIFVSLIITWVSFFIMSIMQNLQNFKKLIFENLLSILLLFFCIPIYFLENIFEKFFQIEPPLPFAKEIIDVAPSKGWDFIQIPVWSLFEFLNENHINTIFIVLFFIMFVIVLYKNKLKLKKTFFNYLFILTIFAILLFEIGNRGVTGARIVFLFEALIIILSFLLIYIVAKILFKKNNIQIYFVAILVGLLFFNITPFFMERINLDYGAVVSNDSFRTTHVAAYRADYKTTSEFVLKNSSESDIIITVMSTNYFYLRRNADYYLNQNVRWNTSSLFDGNNFISLTSSSIILNSPEDINSIIKNNLNKKIWLLVNGASINILSTTHVRKDFINFIKNNEDKLIYISPDGESKIFLFNQ